MDALLVVINQIFVPEILAFIQRKKNETGTWPSVDEVRAEVLKLHDVIKAEGEAFLNRPKG